MGDDIKQQYFVNDACISYSRKDREFAARVEKGLNLAASSASGTGKGEMDLGAQRTCTTK